MALPQQVELFEKSLVSQALAHHQGRINEVCETLGLPRKTLYDKLRKYGLKAEDYRQRTRH
ncbi:helix-turn-helix domain-containing protein [Halomonas sp.]|jgi:two-component system C4-dicarboxylate transport response regulator DctD|uniref:helix-turn-helix domain-containing protein n=1 Tax=Halomonas sp. TaxID=1486246 RepID=UPI0035687B8E